LGNALDWEVAAPDIHGVLLGVAVFAALDFHKRRKNAHFD
jgi:hypothetical protein